VIEPEIASGKGGYGKEGFGKGSKGKKGGYGKGTTRKLPYAEQYKTSEAKKSKSATNIGIGSATCPANGEPCAIGEGTCKCCCISGDFEDWSEYGAKL
jgi:hypothetical protein